MLLMASDMIVICNQDGKRNFIIKLHFIKKKHKNEKSMSKSQNLTEFLIMTLLNTILQ